MLGAAPEIRNKGELEATAAWSLTNRLDVSATYALVHHVLVRAAASTKGSRAASGDSSSYAQSKQYELAAGTYWPLGEQWLVGGLAGFGHTYAHARYDDDGDARLFIFRSPRQHWFDASYGKLFGEAYVAWRPSPGLSLGLSYRLVQLRLTDVTDVGVPVQAAPILRGEPMAYLNLRPRKAQGLWQVRLAVVTSGTFGYNGRTANDAADPVRQFKLGRGYLSLGVAFYPHVLWRK